MRDSPGEICGYIARAMEDGHAIPFLGAGASLPGRPRDARWLEDRYLPSGAELTAYLARAYRYPPRRRESNRSLVRIAQYAGLRAGQAPFFRALHKLFDVPHRPNEVHCYLAEQPRRQLALGLPNPWPVIVTTNYDDRLERAFDDIGADYDLVVYTGGVGEDGPFRHRGPDRRWRSDALDDTYDDFDIRRRPVILKLHGGIAVREGDPEHFVITEDHYISYLARDALRRLPATLLGELQDGGLVFLGYRLEDWNVRVLLSRIQQEQHDSSHWWAIQRSPNEVDCRFWDRHDVTLVELELDDWVRTMRARAPRGPGT